MARPLKHDYAEVDRLLSEGMTAYQVAKQLGMSIPTVYNHSRTLDKFDATPDVLEKLGNPGPVSFPWGMVYASNEQPKTLYKFVSKLNDKTALTALGELVIFELGVNNELGSLLAIVTNKLSISKEMEVALRDYGITILLKGEL